MILVEEFLLQKRIQNVDESYNYLMLVLIIVFFIFFFFIGYSRHNGFLTNIYDLGYFDQAVWGIIHKGYPINTIWLNQPINEFGLHFNPILYLFVPLYVIKPTVIWFIVAQALALSIAAWPIFLLAKHLCESSLIGLFWGIIFLINPFVVNAATWDFHPVVLAVPFISLAIFSIEKKNFFCLTLASVFVLICKEHLGFVVAGFGLLWGLKHREFHKTFLLIAVGVIHFILVFKYIMPAFSPTGEHQMICQSFLEKSNRHTCLQRYSWLGNSLIEILGQMVRHPLFVLKTVFFEFKGLSYFALLFAPFLGLPLLKISFLLPGVGILAANVLSANPMPRDIYAYHSAALIPFFCHAAIQGTKSFFRIRKSISVKNLATLIMINSFIIGQLLSSLPLPWVKTNFWAPNKIFNTKKDPVVDLINSQISSDFSMSVQANLGAHFSQREKIFRFPNKKDEADIIILKLESPTSNLIPPLPGYIGTFAHHLQLTPNDYFKNIMEILKTKKYGISFWKDPWLVLQKNKSNDFCKEEILLKIETIRHQIQASSNRPLKN